MIKCKTECPTGKGMYCCSQCELNITCLEACMDTPTESTDGGCGNAIIEAYTTDLQLFQMQQAAVIKRIADIVISKKQLDEQEKELKEHLKLAMERNSIKAFNNDVLKITYVAATTATSVDSKKLKEKHPAIYQECSKTSPKSAYVKVEVK